MGSTKTAKACIKGAVKHVVETLKAIDRGDHVSTDFMSRADVNDFCRAIGFKEKRLWGNLLDKEIANEGDAPSVVPKDEAETILNLLKAEIDNGTFTPDISDENGKLKSFDKTVLNDFLPKDKGGLGYIWEYQFGLKVELEHGRTLGANVTNNHPLLTGIIVMAHLVETTLYYARLWVMEVEGEIFNGKLKGDDTTDLEAELAKAKEYLAAREAEKVATKGA
ncbi:hypothetical protein GCAAIG_01615 [Candidatus Electronema halotolerans]